MEVRDRVVDVRRVTAGELRQNPLNWRTHPRTQADALEEMLERIGFVSPIVARELDDGSLEMIDGHLRASLADDAVVPVAVVDLDADEAAEALATIDPLSTMARTNSDRLEMLLGSMPDIAGLHVGQADALAGVLAAAPALEDVLEEGAAKQRQVKKCPSCGFEW